MAQKKTRVGPNQRVSLFIYTKKHAPGNYTRIKAVLVVNVKDKLQVFLKSRPAHRGLYQRRSSTAASLVRADCSGIKQHAAVPHAFNWPLDITAAGGARGPPGTDAG